MSNLHTSIENIIDHFYPKIKFEPITSDEDELTQSIENDVHIHENDWQLKENPDAEKLGVFWDEVLAELGPEKQEDEETPASDKT